MNWLRERYRNRRSGHSTLINMEEPNASQQISPTEPLVIPGLPTAIPAYDVHRLRHIGFDIDQTPTGVQTLLGSGAFAAVFSGEANDRAVRYHDTNVEGVIRVEVITGRRVAVKFIHMYNIIKNRKEAEVMAGLQHRNIVDLYDVLVVSRRLYIIMEYCSGGTIRSYLMKCAKNEDLFMYFSHVYTEKLTQQKCENFIRQLFDGLLYLHGKQVLHSDIHCGNVLLVRPDTDPENITLKYADFGIARVLEDPITDPTNDIDVQMDLSGLGYVIRDVVMEVLEEGEDVIANDRLRQLSADLIDGRYKTLADAEKDFALIVGH